jgi:flagellar hook-basal body complex protein FliE
MPIAPLTGVVGTLPTAPTKVAAPTTGAEGFGGNVGQALDQLAATQTKSDDLAVKAATGDLQDAHEFMIAATQASLATELTVAVRNKAVESFQSIMNMGV